MSSPAEGAVSAAFRKVLLIEDSEFVHQLYRVAFRRLGRWTLTHAYDGKKGLDAIYADRPDLVILDMHMPVMDGVAVLDELARMPKSRRPGHVLVATTDVGDPQIREAFRRGADSFLRKPFTLEQFLGLIERITAVLPPVERQT